MNNSKNTYKPILPLPTDLIKEMAPEFDVSYSLLYKVIRHNHQPSPITIRRISKATGLSPSIWELQPHETSAKLYEWYISEDKGLQDDATNDNVGPDPFS